MLAEKTGAGAIHVALPDALRKLVGVNEYTNYLPSTPSGSFAKQGLAELLSLSDWADMILIIGDLGRNSETTILLEQFLAKYSGPLTITRDAIDLLLHQRTTLMERSDTILVAASGQIQKLALGYTEKALNHQMPTTKVVDYLAKLSLERSIITSIHSNIFVAVNGIVSTTPSIDEHWRTETATKASIWAMHFPDKQFEAITSSVTEYM